MILRKRTPFFAGLLACALLAGCHSGNEGGTGTTGGTTTVQGTTGGGNTGGGAGMTQLAFVTNNPSDYWIICRKGTEAAQKELGNVNVEFVMPDPGTADIQKQKIDALLTKGVKGIAISPVDPANQTTYLNTVAGQTNLITSDSDAADSKRLCYIGTDNVAAGRMASDLIKAALPKGGKIILFVGKRDAQNAKEREQGIRDGLKGTNVTVLDVRTDDADHARAKQNAADALTSTPDLAGMVGLWSYNGPAIYHAVKEANKAGKVQIIAFDQEADTMSGIKDGTIYGTVVQQPYKFGYESVKMLAKLAAGDKSGIPAGKVEIVPTQAIKKDNIAQYEADQAKLMGGK